LGRDKLGVLQDNVASFAYGYDGLNRLISADMGALDPANQLIVNDASAPIPLTTDWTLDNLGNWTGDAGYGGFVQTGDLDGDGVMDGFAREVDHIVDGGNQVTGVGPHHKPELAVEHHYDPVGNLVADGTYHYQYDAFNRLIRVSTYDAATQFDEFGRMVAGVWREDDA
jgi:YD repeat-containing protein